MGGGGVEGEVIGHLPPHFRQLEMVEGKNGSIKNNLLIR